MSRLALARRSRTPLAAPALTPQPIPFLAPELPPLDLLQNDFARIYEAKIFSNGGAFERQFSERLSQSLGVAHCIPVSNATIGLMLAAKAVARPFPRRKVLVPSFTFAASVLSLQWAGLEPVFCDIDPGSWQAEPNGARELLAPIKDELALILLCNTFGAPADLEAWRTLAAELDVPLLVDSAPGLGARYPDGKMQGQSGFVEVFSMHATKVFAVGEGGVVTTDDAVLAERIRRMRNFGFDAQRVCGDLGLNAKLSEMQAAIACRVLDGFEGICAHRRARAKDYIERLAPLGFRFQRDGDLSVYQFVPARVPDGISVAKLRERMAAVGIETRTYFAPPLHQQPQFLELSRVGSLNQTEAVSRTMISLPMSNRLSLADVHRICDAIVQALPASELT